MSILKKKTTYLGFEYNFEKKTVSPPVTKLEQFRQIDFDKLNQNLENFETLLTRHLEEQKPKRRFFGKRK